LSGLDQLAENVGTAAEGPVAFQRVPEGEGWREVAEKEVGHGEGQDERVPGADLTN
jgi:hypothetical protein